MFKKLQNKFLIINIVSIFTVFVIALGSIYIITYTNVQKQNKNKLEEGSNISLSVPSNIIADMEVIGGSNTIENIEGEIFYTQKISTDFSVPFNVILNEKNEIMKINSYLDMPVYQYEELVKLVLDNENSNILKYKNKNWMYKIAVLEQYDIIGGQSANTTTQKQISFLDITEEINSLNILIITLISIGLVMLIVIYFISLYFAKKAIEPIKEAWEKQKQFVENASHELKTPIAAIKANTDVLLLNHTDTVKEQTKWIDYIKLETNKMSDLINQLLHLAKMENYEEKVQKSKFNISQKLENMLVSKEALAFEKQIKVETEIEKNIILFQEEETVKQILEILLDNAFKYTNTSGKIKVSLTKEKSKIKIMIQNTGIGIDQKDLPHIFDRFYKADKARTNEDNSYGLGLSIAKIATEKIGGKIIAQSEPNKLTTFTVLLKEERLPDNNSKI